MLELGQLLAGPFATSILGYYGAEIIKIEPPGSGDPIRTWRVMRDGVSLWWQSGPYASRTGFASVCEGIGGFRYINGFPGEAPVRPNLSLGDTLAAIHCVIGILLACVHRLKKAGNPGQLIDTAIYEAVFNMMEGIVPEYSGAGVVREPSGSTLTGIVPTNTYRCADGRFVIISGNGDSIYKRLMNAMGRADLAEDPRMSSNTERVQHEKEIDAAITAWTRILPSAEVLALLDKADVPAGPIYSVVDMMADEHFRARGLFEQVEVNGRSLAIPAMVPKLSDTPGRTDWPGPAIGQHNREVFGDLLGYSAQELDALLQEGVI